MPDPEQEPLFSQRPDREYQPGEESSWKDKALEEDRAKLHDAPADDFDRKDTHAQQTMGRAGLESQGMSRRQADRVLQARVARDMIEKSSRERAEAEAAETEKRERERLEGMMDLLKDTPSGPEPGSTS